MSSAKPREVPPKGNMKSGSGGGSANKSGNRGTGKGDIKSDKVDLNPKIQATAEQMQIARIIESHRSEDPELQKKIKQVIEITGSTPDAASMALHSRDNNLEDAITLLTEGGPESLELEWEQAGKKKKIKTAAQKDAAKEAGQRKENGPGRERPDKRSESRPERGDRDRTTSISDAPQGDAYFEGRGGRGGGRGRGRGDSRGGRGGGLGRGGLGPRVENKENDESSDQGGYGTRFTNGPLRGRGRGGGRGGGFRGGDRDRDSTRTFANRSRGAREGDFGHNTIDVWENSQADTNKSNSKPNLKVDQWSEFPPAEDWDNEEYTGSLAESKVFVPSTQQSGTEGAPPSQATPPNGESHLPTESATNGIVGPTNHLGSAAGHVVAGQSIDLSLLLAKQTPPVSVANAGANLLASIQSSYSSAAQQQISQPLLSRPKVATSQQTVGGGGGGGAATRPPQRTLPSTKIPVSGVEMPDDSIAKLDVQFGGLDFGSSGSTFNSVLAQQHGGSTKAAGGSGDMMYSSVAQGALVDPYAQTVSSVEKEMVQKQQSGSTQGDSSASAFQSQQRVGPAQGSQSQQSIPDSISKSVPLSSANMEGQQLGGLSSVQSQNQGQKMPPPVSQHSQTSPYTNTAGGNSHGGSAFVTYNTKPAPGFPAPGFPPVISQTQQTGPGAYNAVATGQIYGSQPSMIMTHTQQPSTGYGMGLSTYGSLPIVSASVQPSHLGGGTIPNQNMTQMSNSTSSYGVPGGIPYQSATTIPNSVGYNTSAASYNPYQKLNQMSTSGPMQQGMKESGGDLGSSSTTATSSSAQLASTALQGNSTSSAVKISSNVSAGSTTSKLQNTTGGGTTAGSMPPGMVIPQYIVNQGALQGVPMYGFQGPMYSYDENQMQFLPRLPHPAIAASYFDANASSFTPGGAGRSDGSSLQSYPGSDARFSRSDSSAASPVPSNLPGGTTQAMYNIPQGGGYYYLGNNPLVHPGAFAQYAPPQMYPTTGLVTPNNPSGAPHTVSNHQYPAKGVSYGNSYINPYDTTPQQTQLSTVTDYGNKPTYSTGGSGVAGGPNSTGGTSGKGSVSTTGSSQQSTDMSSSIYGNKPHLNKMTNPYEKQQQYGAGASAGYNSMGQQGNQLGTGMGTPYNVYMPPAPDGSAGQRQGGQPKGGKQQQYGQQQYWGGN